MKRSDFKKKRIISFLILQYLHQTYIYDRTHSTVKISQIYNKKNLKTTFSEHFQNPMEKSQKRSNRLQLIHIYVS